MEQLSMFDTVHGVALANADEWPTQYRQDSHGFYVVTARYPGVGTLQARHRFLWEATCEVRRQIAVRQQVARALAAAPSSMF